MNDDSKDKVKKSVTEWRAQLNDSPEPTGERLCINPAAIDFEPT